MKIKKTYFIGCISFVLLVILTINLAFKQDKTDKYAKEIYNNLMSKQEKHSKAKPLNIKITNTHWCMNDFGNKEICGSIFNETGINIDFISMAVALYDSENREIGVEFVEIKNVISDTEIKFNISLADKNYVAVDYKIVDVRLNTKINEETNCNKNDFIDFIIGNVKRPQTDKQVLQQNTQVSFYKKDNEDGKEICKVIFKCYFPNELNLYYKQVENTKLEFDVNQGTSATDMLFCLSGWVFNIDAIEDLLVKGADVNYTTTDRNESFFIKSVQMGQHDIVKYLIKNGANINQFFGSNLNTTALDTAVEFNDVKMAEILLKNGANPLLNSRIYNLMKGFTDKSMYNLLKKYNVQERF